jgi:hypothetical protein
VGLIARTIEQVGMSTVCFNLLMATPSRYVCPPRTIWLPFFPFSLPLGLPGNEPMQRQLVLHALEMLVTSRTPGTVQRFPYKVWGSGREEEDCALVLD